MVHSAYVDSSSFPYITLISNTMQQNFIACRIKEFSGSFSAAPMPFSLPSIFLFSFQLTPFGKKERKDGTAIGIAVILPCKASAAKSEHPAPFTQDSSTAFGITGRDAICATTHPYPHLHTPRKRGARGVLSVHVRNRLGACSEPVAHSLLKGQKETFEVQRCVALSSGVRSVRASSRQPRSRHRQPCAAIGATPCRSARCHSRLHNRALSGTSLAEHRPPPPAGKR